MQDEKRAQIKEIIEFFRGKPVNQEVLQEYCNRRKYEVIVLSDYEDMLFQYEHDERFTRVMPLLMTEMLKLKQPPEFATHAERKAVFDNNNAVELAMSKVLEDNDILYSEAETLLKNLGTMLQGVTTGASNRITNMGVATMLDIAEKQLGKPLKIKACAEYVRKEADTLARMQETKTP
jgi:hypothetical protein